MQDQSPKEQDLLTHVDRLDDGWGRAGQRPTGPKRESRLNKLLPESRAEGRSGAKPCGRNTSFKKTTASHDQKERKKMKLCLIACRAQRELFCNSANI